MGDDMGDDPPLAIHTIGHSNHPPERLLALLQGAAIDSVVDVRSVPWSRRLPHVRRTALAALLAEAGIAYVFSGDRLGARATDPACWREGRADHDLIAATASFRRGLVEVEALARQGRVALLCAERDPLDCHRTTLVGRRLQERGARLLHILADGDIEPSEATERRLLARTGRAEGDLFDPPLDDSSALDRAWDARAREIAWRRRDD